MGSKSKKIKVLVVDDHHIVRSGLKIELSKAENIEYSGDASSGIEAKEMIKLLKPHVILLDISMPEMDGFAAAKQFLKINPKLKIIALTIHENKNYAAEFIRAGGHGYVVKDTSPEELIKAIETVCNENALYISPKMNNGFEAKLNKIRVSKVPFVTKLTPRETVILRYIANGYANKKIAKELSISIRTVEVHRDHIYKKLNLSSVAEITKYAIKNNLTELPI